MAVSEAQSPARFETNAGVSVAVRVRPRLEHEVRGRQGQIVCLPVNSQAVQLGTDSLWGYDVALGEQDGSGSVWEKCRIASLIDGAFNGFNASIIAYGQTGSGKTFTMGMTDPEGEKKMHSVGRSNAARPSGGIASKVCATIAETLLEVNNAVSVGVAGPHGLTSLDVSVSCIQVYCEQLHDLLHPETPSSSIAVRTTRNGATIVTGAQSEPANSLDDMHRWLNVGISARTSGSTAMSEASSRSHLVFSIGLRGTQLLQNGSTRRVNSIIRLVDLAGSERQKKTLASGTRFAESVHINGGLLALGNVINALAAASATPETKLAGMHIPYRDSKLTRLLVDCLGGNGRTLFIACVSPTASNQHETLSTLRYAQRVLAIKNHPAAQVELVPLPEHKPPSHDEAGDTEENQGGVQAGSGGPRSRAKSRTRAGRSSSARHRQRARDTAAGPQRAPTSQLNLSPCNATDALGKVVAWLLSLPGASVSAVHEALQQRVEDVQAMLPPAEQRFVPLTGGPPPPHLLSGGGSPIESGTPPRSTLDASVLSPVVMPPALPPSAEAPPPPSQQASSATVTAPTPAGTGAGDGELQALRRALAVQAAQLDAAEQSAQQQRTAAAEQLAAAQSELALLRTALAAAEASHLSGLAVSRHDVSPAKSTAGVVAHTNAASVAFSSAHSRSQAAGAPSSPPAAEHHSATQNKEGNKEHSTVFDSELEQSIRDTMTPLQPPRPPRSGTPLTSERRAALQSTVKRLRAEVSRAVVSASRAHSLDESNHSWANVTALERQLAQAQQQLLQEGSTATAAPPAAEPMGGSNDESFASDLAESISQTMTPQRGSNGGAARGSVSHGVAAAVAAAAEAVARELETPAVKRGRGGSEAFVRGGTPAPPASVGRLRGAVQAAARSLGLQADSPAVAALQHLCDAAAGAAAVSAPSPAPSVSEGSQPRAQPATTAKVESDILGASASFLSSNTGQDVRSAAHVPNQPPEQLWAAKERRWHLQRQQLQSQLDQAEERLKHATRMPFQVGAGATAGSPGGAQQQLSPMAAAALPASGDRTQGGGSTLSPHAPSQASISESAGASRSAVTRLDFTGVFDSDDGDSDDAEVMVAADDVEGPPASPQAPHTIRQRDSEAYTSAPSATWGRGRLLQPASAAGLQLLSSLDERELRQALTGCESPGSDSAALHTSGMVWSLGT